MGEPATTIRDLLLDAEQARAEVVVRCVDHSVKGEVADVGVDYVTVETLEGPVDVALFHVVSLTASR